MKLNSSKHSKRNIALSLAAVFGLAFGWAGRAAVYYVDVTAGSDSNNGTSQSGAWAHLPGTVGVSGSGWAQLVNGDTVYVKGGTLNNFQVKFTSTDYNGSAAYDSIRVMSGHLAATPWGSGRAIFDGQNSRTFGLWIASGNGLTVDGFEVRNIQAGGVGSGFDPSVGSCCVAIGGSSAVHFCKLRRSYLHDAIRTVTDTGHGIETDGSGGSRDLIIEMNNIGPNVGTKGVEVQTYDYGALRNNFITGTGDHGIVITGNRWDVYNNVVYMKPPYAHEPVFGIKVNFNYNDIWNNLVYQDVQTTTGSTANDLEGIGTLDNSSNNRFYFNTIINCADLANNRTGAGISLADENASGSHNDVQNCIAAFCKNNIGGSWSTVQVYLGTGASSDSFRYCNLWSGGSSDTVCAYNSGSGYQFYNCATAVSASSVGNANTFQNMSQADPRFTGGGLPTGLDANFRPNTAYFQLTATTPAAITTTGNSGLTGNSVNGYSSAANKFSTDILGNPRTKWSMGAYEYSTTTSSSPLPPSNLRIASTAP